MGQSTTPRPARKPRPRPERSLQVLKPIDHRGQGLIEITVGSDVNDYSLTLGLAYDGEALGVELHKDTGERYHVCLPADPQYATCDCQGFLRWAHCKHIDALARMLQLGLLRLPSEIVINLDEPALDQLAVA